MALRMIAKPSPKEEAEKPFWISFSDLMTALMVLFLVAMAVALLAVTKGVSDIKAQEGARAASVDLCITDIRNASRDFPGVTIRDHTIDFGTLANFGLASNQLKPEQGDFLRRFVPRVLTITKRTECQNWLKRIVVDGFASDEGSYMTNLNLSIQRSERVLCALLDPNAPNAPEENDRKLIQKLFLVGGSSSNSLKRSREESRRIELRVEFYDLKEPREQNPPDIPLSRDLTCPIESR